mmetsp:Transcript_78559/g.139374  ORF Transcript_78559/g.139374 Transcript_78559/m.139374 type:complete len:217 (-) Transcript_78559:211-861(-)
MPNKMLVFAYCVWLCLPLGTAETQPDLLLLQLAVDRASSYGSKSIILESADDSITGSTCGLDDSVEVIDCDKPDMGSCGNACCALEVSLEASPDTLYGEVAGFLQSGGSDGAYKLVPGKMPYDEHPADNVTGLAPEPWKFIFQGTHTTAGRHYNDTLNFNIRSGEHTPSILRAFSISDLHGALGDSGQNFKNLAYLMKSLNISMQDVQLLYGCGLE